LAKQKTKVSFWATKNYKKWKKRDMKFLYQELLKIEDKLEKIREKLFEKYTE
jgi:hypothetical protein